MARGGSGRARAAAVGKADVVVVDEAAVAVVGDDASGGEMEGRGGAVGCYVGVGAACAGHEVGERWGDVRMFCAGAGVETVGIAEHVVLAALVAVVGAGKISA